jgi:hypothetical protein
MPLFFVAFHSVAHLRDGKRITATPREAIEYTVKALDPKERVEYSDGVPGFLDDYWFCHCVASRRARGPTILLRWWDPWRMCQVER